MEDGPEEIGTPYAPRALGAYSQAVKAGGFVFVSGQLGIDPDTGELWRALRLTKPPRP